MPDTLEMIYGVSIGIKQKEMNTQVQKVETPNNCERYPHGWCSTIGSIEGHVINFMTKKI